MLPKEHLAKWARLEELQDILKDLETQIQKLSIQIKDKALKQNEGFNNPYELEWTYIDSFPHYLQEQKELTKLSLQLEGLLAKYKPLLNEIVELWEFFYK